MDPERPLDAVPEPTPVPAETGYDFLDLPPEISAEITGLLPATLRFQQYSAEYIEEAGRIPLDDPRHFQLIRASDYFADLQTTNWNYINGLVASCRRRQKLARIAGRISAVFRLPRVRLGHDTAAEALPPVIEDGGLAGG